MIRVGLLGCGFMGNMHAACYAALADLGVKLTAVSDQALDAAQALGAAEPAALIERNRTIAEAFAVGKDTAPHIRRYYDDLIEQTAKELAV